MICCFRGILTIFFFFLFISFALNGCSGVHSFYNAKVINVGKGEIKKLEIYFDGKALVAGGYMAPGQSKTHSRLVYPVPKQITVSWYRGNVHYEKNVEFAKKLKLTNKGDEYYIVIFVDDANDLKINVELCDFQGPCIEIE